MAFQKGNQYAKKLKGRKQTEDHKNKKTESLKRFYQTDAGRLLAKEKAKKGSKKQSIAMIKRWKDNKYRKNVIAGSKGHKKSPEAKINYRLAMTKRWKNQKYRKKCFAIWHSEEYKKKRSKTTTKLWKDDIYIEKVLKGLNLGIRKRPTSYEKTIIDLIGKYNLPYKYTGDFNFRIGTKNPDFIHLNKQICVEVYEDFYKIKTFGSIEKYIKDRIEYFTKRGWKTIFINGNQLQDEKLVVKLLN